MLKLKKDYKPRKKRSKVNKDQDKDFKEKQKIAKRRGEQYVSCKGFLVKAKSTGPDCNCRKKCTTKFTTEERRSIIYNVHNGRSKNVKNAYLSKLIEKHNVAQPSPFPKGSKRNSSSCKYFAIKGTSRIEVCRKAYKSLHAISEFSLLCLIHRLEINPSSVILREKQADHSNTLDATIIIKIDNHISSFPKKEFHNSSPPVTYMNSGLTVVKLHEFFIEKYPDLKEVVKYECYLQHFKETYGYRFGSPQEDVCLTCENLSAKINSSFLNEVEKKIAVAELLVHKRRANKFQKKIQDVRKICIATDDVMAIDFAFMENLSLPVMPNREMFNIQKLEYYAFSIHNIGNETSIFYTYTDGEAHKGPNEVCTAFLDFISNEIPKDVKTLHVFGNACPDRNRRHALAGLFTALTMIGRFSFIHQYYPFQGHSSLPCYRNFTVINQSIRRLDQIYSPLEYNDIIRTARKRNIPHQVKELQNRLVLNFKDWWPQYFRKGCKDIEKKILVFDISKYSHLMYSEEGFGCVMALEFIDGSNYGIFKLNRKDHVELPNDNAYGDKIAINIQKLEGISKVIQYVPEHFKAFYEQILQYPSTIKEDIDDDE